MRAPRPFFFAQVTATRLVRVGWGRERPYLLLSRPEITNVTTYSQ